MSIPGGIRVKLALALLAIVGGALLAAYVIVVPSLERRLVDAKLDQQQSDAETLAINYATQAAQNTPALGRLRRRRRLHLELARRRLRRRRHARKRTLLSLGRLLRGRRLGDRDGPDRARGRASASARCAARVQPRRPRVCGGRRAAAHGGDVMLLSSSLADQLATVALVKRRLLVRHARGAR